MNERDLGTEQQLQAFYDSAGWKSDAQGTTKDAELWEDLRECARTYVSDCRRRISSHIPDAGGERILDAASGPIQYDEYLEYSLHFKKRYCVDISAAALEQARSRIGASGEFIKTSILELPFPDNFFDTSISLHTIYHIQQNEQEMAVRQLIRVTRRGVPLIIIYSNPDRFFARVRRWLTGKTAKAEGPIYFHAHPLAWWNRFTDECELKLLPWRSLTAKDAWRFVPDNALGRLLLQAVFRWEALFPGWATSWGAYPMIVLVKR